MARDRDERYNRMMPAKTSPTLRVLREIRDELKGTNKRLESVDSRLGSVDGRLVAVEERVVGLERRQTETEVRLATEIIAVATAVGEVRDLLRERLDDRVRVDEHERRIAALERRVG
jgi:predicted  nucleic acid-binding Zn-ribbon protein